MGKRKEEIRNIIFDVGDVLLEYRWRDMLEDNGLEREDAIRLGNLIFEEPLWGQLDIGERQVEDIIQDYEKKFPEYGETIRWFITHGEFMHVHRPKVWEKVHSLKEKGYQIYLLSNYSEELFHKHTKDTAFLKDIQGKVVSYEIHAAKPDKKIYEHLLHTYQLNPTECIFFDDRLENVKAGQEMGIYSVQVTSQNQLLEMLEVFLDEEKKILEW